MTQRRLTRLLAACAFTTALSIIVSCSRSVSEDLPIKITPNKPLTAKVGDEVEWSFNAKRGSRQLRVVDISFDNSPLGMRKVFDEKQKTITLKGKVLTRDVRHGLIRVTGFDEKACDDNYERLKQMATEQVKATGNKDMAIPTNPCRLAGGTDYSDASQFMQPGYFAWAMIDGPESLAVEAYSEFIAKNLFAVTFTPPGDGMVEIPSREAPDTADVTIGRCGALPRKQCGKEQDCLWGLGACISKSTTGRSPVSEAIANGSQSPSNASPQGKVKQ
jgi:hypothetical protein